MVILTYTNEDESRRMASWDKMPPRSELMEMFNHYHYPIQTVDSASSDLLDHGTVTIEAFNETFKLEEVDEDENYVRPNEETCHKIAEIILKRLE